MSVHPAALAVDPAKQNQLFVISDIHIGSTWTSPERLKQCCQFLEYVAAVEQSRARVLVLLGDVVELWQAAFDELPLTWEQVGERDDFRDFAKLVRRALDNGVRVFWAKGNHDGATTAEDVHEHVDRRVEFVEDRLEAVAGVVFAHGHAHDLFNRTTDIPVRSRMPISTRDVNPLGYWLCRSDRERQKHGAGKNADTAVSAQAADVLSWLLDIAARALPGRPLLEMMFAKALDRPWEEVKFLKIRERGRFFFRPVIDATLDDVCEGWQGVFDALLAKGKEHFRASVEAALGSYGDVFHEYPENHLVVFGHTHHPTAERYGSRFYINSGGWVDDIQEAGTFLRLDLDTTPELKLASIPDGTVPAEPLRWLDAGKVAKVDLASTTGARVFAGFRSLLLDQATLPQSDASRRAKTGHVRSALELMSLGAVLPLVARRGDEAVPGPGGCCKCKCGSGPDIATADLVVRFKCPKCDQTGPVRLQVERRPKQAEVRRLVCSARSCRQVCTEPPSGSPPLSTLDLLVGFVAMLCAPWKSADPHNRKIKGEHVYPFVLSLQANFPSLHLSTAIAASLIPPPPALPAPDPTALPAPTPAGPPSAPGVAPPAPAPAGPPPTPALAGPPPSQAAAGSPQPPSQAAAGPPQPAAVALRPAAPAEEEEAGSEEDASTATDEEGS